MHLLSQTKTGLSAMELKRQLGVKYDTAWMLKHKLLQTMKESDDKQPISGILLDDVYWRGVAWRGECRGGKRGRGAAGKTPFVAAVALNKEGHPIKIRMTVVDGFKTKSIADWAKWHVANGSAVISYGLACFKAVKEANCHRRQPGLAGSSCIQLGKYDDRKCEKLSAGLLPYARSEAFTKASCGILLPV